MSPRGNPAEARINGIAVICAVVLGMGALTAYGALEAREALVNSPSPRQMTVDEVVRNAAPTRSYVSVKGEFYPVVFRFGEGEKGRVKRVERAWAPLVDPQHERGLFVEVRDPFRTRVDEVPRVQPITGMLRPIDARLKARMKDLSGKLGPVAFETERMLVQGQRPGNPIFWIAQAAIAGVLMITLPALIWRRLSTPAATPADPVES